MISIDLSVRLKDNPETNLDLVRWSLCDVSSIFYGLVHMYPLGRVFNAAGSGAAAAAWNSGVATLTSFRNQRVRQRVLERFSVLL